MPWTVRYRVPDGKRFPGEVMALARETLKVPPRKYRATSYTDAVLDVIAFTSMTINGATYQLHNVTPANWQRKIRAHVVQSKAGQHIKVGELRYQFTERDLDDFTLNLHQTRREVPAADVQQFFKHVRREFRHFATTSRSVEFAKLLWLHVRNCRHERLAPGLYRLFDLADVQAMDQVVRLVPEVDWEVKQEGEQ